MQNDCKVIALKWPAKRLLNTNHRLSSEEQREERAEASRNQTNVFADTAMLKLFEE